MEYKGLYDLDKPFKVKSEKAYILNEEPDIVYMNTMHVILYLNDGRIVNIISNKGSYNKRTYDCFFEDEVKIYALDELKTHLTAELNIVDIELNALDQFPYMSLKFSNVLVQDTTENYIVDTVFYAKSMYLSFDFMDIIKRIWVIMRL